MTMPTTRSHGHLARRAVRPARGFPYQHPPRRLPPRPTFFAVKSPTTPPHHHYTLLSLVARPLSRVILQKDGQRILSALSHKLVANSSLARLHSSSQCVHYADCEERAGPGAGRADAGKLSPALPHFLPTSYPSIFSLTAHPLLCNPALPTRTTTIRNGHGVV
jgi:hypothetical protein